MRIIRRVLIGVLCASLGTVAVFAHANADNAVSEDSTAISVDAANYIEIPSILKPVNTPPKVAQPNWLKKQIEAEKAASIQAGTSGSNNIIVAYSVQTRGEIQSSLSEFKQLVQQTLTDSRGWAGIGITFKQVDSGGSFNLILAQAEEVDKASSGCSAEWSCRVGTSVFINDDRWSGATDAWNTAGGSLRDYRHMVVNHEVGHWLGHDHRSCGGKGKLAPLMQQQSISLQGCKFNAWPLSYERFAPNLGIY